MGGCPLLNVIKGIGRGNRILGRSRELRGYSWKDTRAGTLYIDMIFAIEKSTWPSVSQLSFQLKKRENILVSKGISL